MNKFDLVKNLLKNIKGSCMNPNIDSLEKEVFEDVLGDFSKLEKFAETDNIERSLINILHFTAKNDTTIIRLYSDGYGGNCRNLEYRLKKSGKFGEWIHNGNYEYDNWFGSFVLNAGDSLYLRAQDFGSQGEYRVEISDYVECSGDITSLCNGVGGDVSLKNGAFHYLFMNCDKLLTAPNLPSTSLNGTCYNSMFEGCTSLKVAPKLPALNLKDSCYKAMFKNCTSLIEASELPALNLASDCYYGMFQNCTSLLKAPLILPGDGGSSSGTSYYAYMFQNCTSLKVAPEIKIENMGWDGGNNNALAYMFEGCTSLIKAPSILPSTKLRQGCYRNMFKGCTSLIEAPELPATYLRKYCYSNMFYNCSKLNKVICFASSKESYSSSSDNPTFNWLYGVANNGIFIKGGDYSYDFGVSGIPGDWVINDYESQLNLNYLNFYTKVNNILSIKTSYNFEYSFDKRSWFIGNNNNNNFNIPLEVDQIVYLRGKNYKFSGGSSDGCFSSSEEIYCDGDITTLLTPKGGIENLTNYDSSVFQYLFKNFDKLVTPPDLSKISILKYGCYSYMFEGCTSLKVAPKLPAMNLAQNCYQNMFYGCISLEIPPILPAIDLITSCYLGMFAYSGITSVPELPATVLSVSCYKEMFKACNNLTNINLNLPATTVRSGYDTSIYEGMFKNCINLINTVTICLDSIAHPTCIKEMFYNCTKLNKVILYTTDWDTSRSSDWLSGVASEGVLYNLGEATIPTDDASGCPTGWTIETSLPE